MKIYLDMDGVLADFEKRFIELYGPRPTIAADKVNHFWKHWDDFVINGHFETLDMMPDAVTLIDAVKSLGVPYEVLTSSSTPNDPARHRMIADQKIKWLWKNKITCKVNVVTRGEDKGHYAAPWHVLVDDTPYMLEAFRSAGGLIVHHVDISPTLFQLFDHHDDYLEYMRLAKLT